MTLKKIFSALVGNNPAQKPESEHPHCEADHYGVGGADCHFSQEVRSQLREEVLNWSSQKPAD